MEKQGAGNHPLLDTNYNNVKAQRWGKQLSAKTEELAEHICC
jgi:hypothetical protein